MTFPRVNNGNYLRLLLLDYGPKKQEDCIHLNQDELNVMASLQNLCHDSQEPSDSPLAIDFRITFYYIKKLSFPKKTAKLQLG